MRLNSLAAALTVALGPTAATSADIVEVVYPESGHHSQILARVLETAYDRAGIEAQFRPLPSNRAIRMATSGAAVATVARIAAYGERHPDMLKIETPVASLLTTAFVRRDQGIEINEPKDLIGLRVGRIAGILHAKSVSEEVEDVTEVRSLSQLFEMLVSGRIDVAIHSRLPGEYEIARSGLVDVKAIETPLSSQHLFHYVHASHPEIADAIAIVLEQMNTTGELSEAFDQGAASMLADVRNIN